MEQTSARQDSEIFLAEGIRITNTEAPGLRVIDLRLRALLDAKLVDLRAA